MAIVAHILAWVAYLPVAIGLVIWPYLRVGSGEDFIVLDTVFVPVALIFRCSLVRLLHSRTAPGQSVTTSKRPMPF